MVAELRELPGFSVVAKRYIGFECRFVAEQLVFVSFVWSDGDVDRRVERHPRDVAFVVIVRTECVRALVQKISERGISG